MEGHTIIILGVSSSEELIERGLKFGLKLFFAKITFKFIFFIFIFYIYFSFYLFYFIFFIFYIILFFLNFFKIFF